MLQNKSKLLKFLPSLCIHIHSASPNSRFGPTRLVSETHPEPYQVPVLAPFGKSDHDLFTIWYPIVTEITETPPPRIIWPYNFVDWGSFYEFLPLFREGPFPSLLLILLASVITLHRSSLGIVTYISTQE